MESGKKLKDLQQQKFTDDDKRKYTRHAVMQYTRRAVFAVHICPPTQLCVEVEVAAEGEEDLEEEGEGPLKTLSEII